MKQLVTTLIFAAITALPCWADDNQPNKLEAADEPINQEVQIAAEEKPSEKAGGITVRQSDNDGNLKVSIKSGAFNKILDRAQEELDNKDLSDEERAKMEKDIALARDVLGDIDINAALNSEEARMGIMAGMLAIFLFFSTPLVIVALVLYASYRRRRLAHQTINAYVQSGRDIPPELIESLQKNAKVSTPKTSLHKGVVSGGVGLGIFAAFSMIGEQTVAALGLIPLFIGIAQIIVWKLDNRSNKHFGG